MFQMFKILVKAPDMKKAMALGADGTLTTRTIYTVMFKTKEYADEIVAELTEDNPGWTFKVVKF